MLSTDREAGLHRSPKCCCRDPSFQNCGETTVWGLRGSFLLQECSSATEHECYQGSGESRLRVHNPPNRKSDAGGHQPLVFISSSPAAPKPMYTPAATSLEKSVTGRAPSPPGQSRSRGSDAPAPPQATRVQIPQEVPGLVESDDFISVLSHRPGLWLYRVVCFSWALRILLYTPDHVFATFLL